MSEIIRPATAEDLGAIVALLADDPLGATRESPDLPLDPAYLQAFGAIEADPNQLLGVAIRDAAVVGCLQISFLPGLSRKGMWRAQIESVRVARACRGAGLGQRLILWAIERAQARGCGLVQLTSDKSRAGAHAFYGALGFVASHEGFKLALT